MVPTQDLISARNRTLKSQHGMAGHSMIPARAIRVWVGLGLPADCAQHLERQLVEQQG